jgi:hypothetical protein
LRRDSISAFQHAALQAACQHAAFGGSQQVSKERGSSPPALAKPLPGSRFAKRRPGKSRTTES